MYLREQVIRINSYQQQTIESPIHFYSINLMLIAKPTQNRFQLSFKKKEVPIFHKLENDLMEDLGIPTKSDLCFHKETQSISNGVINEDSKTRSGLLPDAFGIK